MKWLGALTLKGLVEAVQEAESFLDEVRGQEAEGTITAASYAYVNLEVDGLTYTIILTTGNREFSGSGSQVRTGHWGGWKVIGHREDLGITTGEDFLPGEAREWLLRVTKPVRAE